jgi:cholest-4-en-3-one 26-monooxygenase
VTLDDIDLSDPDRFVAGVPHEAFKLLRAERKDPQTFSSSRGGTNIFELSPEDLQTTRTLMLNMDPPQHTKYRRLVNQGFTPRMVAALEPHVRDICRRIVDRIAGAGRGDFVTDVAAELPLQVIAELLGVPHEDRHKVFEWSNRLVGFDDPEYRTSLEDGKIAAAGMWGYANELALARRACPRDDLVSVLMRAAVDGEALSEQEFDSFFLLLAVAGNETTRNLISGGMLALLEHPAERARLHADPALLPTAVEEMLRWVTPVTHFRRTATRDTQLRGQAICEGDKVVVFYASANRDESVFADPDRFDVGRTPNEHVAFGFGEHYCIGTTLARLEIRVMFEELLARLPDLELAGPVARLRSNFLNGIKHMPVRFTPATAAARA